jgi:hypothetical protein
MIIARKLTAKILVTPKQNFLVGRLLKASGDPLVDIWYLIKREVLTHFMDLGRNFEAGSKESFAFSFRGIEAFFVYIHTSNVLLWISEPIAFDLMHVTAERRRLSLAVHRLGSPKKEAMLSQPPSAFED